jgi:hypothetical protein
MSESIFGIDILYPKTFLAKYGAVIRSRIGSNPSESLFFHISFDKDNNPIEITEVYRYPKVFERRYLVIRFDQNCVAITVPVAIVTALEKAYNEQLRKDFDEGDFDV